VCPSVSVLYRGVYWVWVRGWNSWVTPLVEKRAGTYCTWQEWTRSRLLFGRYSVPVPAETLGMLPVASRCFRQFLKEDAGIVPRLGHDRLLPNPLQFSHQLTARRYIDQLLTNSVANCNGKGNIKSSLVSKMIKLSFSLTKHRGMRRLWEWRYSSLQ
jgi:hypothetical protein